MKIIKEITDLDKLFGWKYSEVINPYNPLNKLTKPNKQDIDNLKKWASVRDSVRDSVWDSVWASVGASIWAYIGSLFKLPRIEWKYTEKIKTEDYPFQPAVDLWKRGLVPSFDGKKWRLHQMCNKAKVIWECNKKDLNKTLNQS